MTLLVLAPDDDETADRFAAFARDSERTVVVANDLDRIAVSVRVSRDRVSRTRIAVDGVEVTAILSRGLGPWGDEPDADRAFAAAETYAVLWSALALWDGPVVNRPSPQGFFPRLDPLDLVATGAVAASRTVVLNDGSAPGAEVFRLPDWTPLEPDAPRDRFTVVRISDRDPARTRQILVAGTEVIALDGGGLDGVAPVVAWIRRTGVDFATFTVEDDHRLHDVSCFPRHHQFAHVERRVHTALLAGLTP